MRRSIPLSKAIAALALPAALGLCLLFPFKTAFAQPYPSGDTTRVRRGFHEGPLLQAVDSILVVKRYRHMYVFNNNKLLKVYNISLGTSPVGPKHFQGDRKTPEGLYHIDGKNPNSMAHKSIGINYPNDADRRYARMKGKPTGGDIKIHGILNSDEANSASYVGQDWTWGCIAVTNEEVDELYEHIIIGAPICILP